mmetsp:Transcript_73912/g.203492  ORF Transcript_73912/g.203492 Transcript_73912/m.203492 type:complete len:390 (+) Transcript_73912:149-1318(+)
MTCLIARQRAQVEWLTASLDERNRQLENERDERAAALGSARADAHAAREEAARAVELLSEKQATRHVEEMEAAGAAMQRQIAGERQAYLQQLQEHKELHGQLVQARAEARSGRVDVAELRSRLEGMAHLLQDEQAASRAALDEERRVWRERQAEDAERAGEATTRELEMREEVAAAHIAALAEAKRAFDDATAAWGTERQALQQLSASLREANTRMQEDAAADAARFELLLREQAEKDAALRASGARKNVEQLEREISQAERHEEALRGRLRAMHAAAQDELEQKSHGLMALHDSQLHQLRVDHAQLAELHAQAGVALRSVTEHRDAMRAEVEAHRVTQRQLVEMQAALQKERELYVAAGGGEALERARKKAADAAADAPVSSETGRAT